MLSSSLMVSVTYEAPHPWSASISHCLLHYGWAQATANSKGGSLLLGAGSQADVHPGRNGSEGWEEGGKGTISGKADLEILRTQVLIKV